MSQVCLQQGPRDFSGVRGGREGAPEEACANKSVRDQGVWSVGRETHGVPGKLSVSWRAEGLASWKRRRSVQDSERAKLCKIVAQGGERGEQACKGACKRPGGCCVCWGEGRVGRAEGPGEGGRVVRGWQVVESEGIAFPCGLGDDPHPVRLRADPLWLCLSPPPQNRPFPPSSSPSVISSFPPHPTPLPASHTHTVLCQLPPPVRCQCLARSGHLVTSGLGRRVRVQF